MGQPSAALRRLREKGSGKDCALGREMRQEVQDQGHPASCMHENERNTQMCIAQ